jgi:hypothetical protein
LQSTERRGITPGRTMIDGITGCAASPISDLFQRYLEIDHDRFKKLFVDLLTGAIPKN